MIEFEKEIVDYLGLPSIPKKEWDGVTPFDKGVAVVALRSGNKAYAVCAFNPDKGDKSVSVSKVFSVETFTQIEKVYIVPNYMVGVDDVKDMDLDDESKKQAKAIIEEAISLENEGAEDNTSDTPECEYCFPQITNDDEARAFIKCYNKRNKIRGKIPKTHEGLIMRLSVIYSEQNKNK